ncbi:hypothetical protein Tco_1481563, partial [Tanacetum coccineum]
LTDSETESDEEVSPEINAGTQDEGQTEPNPGEQDEGQDGPNPGIQDEGQAGSNPGDASESQPQSSHVVHAGPNLEHMDFQENLKLPTKDQVRLEEPASSAGTLSSLQNLDKELSFTNQFLVEKSQEDEPDKSNTEAEVQSMVMVPIHQDTSLVPLMTNPIIDLTMSQPVSTTVQAPLPRSTATVTAITTTTSLLPPPPQPQQSTTDLILVSHIGELEQHIADLLQDNLALGERLDKHGTQLYNLEKLDIPHKVNQVVDEIVIDAVDWAMQAPLRARFRDMPTVDMKEILQHRMFKDYSYKANNVPDDQDSGDDHTPAAADSRKDCWKPLPEEESPATPEPSWTILPSNVSDVENNWASALALSYEPNAENSLLAKTSDMTTFLNWYCRQINKSKLTQSDLEG